MADLEDLLIAVDIPLPADGDDDDLDSLPSTLSPNGLVTLKCDERIFTFSKSMLIEDSDYFRACLNNSTFVEGRTSVIEFDDIDPQALEAYLDIVKIMSSWGSIDVKYFPFTSERCNEAMGDINLMIEIYRLSDRFTNDSMRFRLSKFILGYMRNGAVMKVDKSSPEGIKWLFNTYKNAHDALDPSIPDEANLQSQIAEVCCRQIGIDKTYALIHTSPKSEAFLEAVLMAATQLVATLLKKNKSLNVKVKRFKLENRMLRDGSRHMDEEEHRDWLANGYVMDHDDYSISWDFDDDGWFIADGGYGDDEDEDDDDDDDEEDDDEDDGEDDGEDDVHQGH